MGKIMLKMKIEKLRVLKHYYIKSWRHLKPNGENPENSLRSFSTNLFKKPLVAMKSPTRIESDIPQSMDGVNGGQV